MDTGRVGFESGKVKGGFDIKVDFNMDIKRVNRGRPGSTLWSLELSDRVKKH